MNLQKLKLEIIRKILSVNDAHFLKELLNLLEQRNRLSSPPGEGDDFLAQLAKEDLKKVNSDTTEDEEVDDLQSSIDDVFLG